MTNYITAKYYNSFICTSKFLAIFLAILAFFLKANSNCSVTDDAVGIPSKFKIFLNLISRSKVAMLYMLPLHGYLKQVQSYPFGYTQ